MERGRERVKGMEGVREGEEDGGGRKKQNTRKGKY